MMGKNINTVPEHLRALAFTANSLITQQSSAFARALPVCEQVWSSEPEGSGKVGKSPCNRAVRRCCLFTLLFPSTSKASLRPPLKNTLNLKLCEPQRNTVLQPATQVCLARPGAVVVSAPWPPRGWAAGRAAPQPGRGALGSAGLGKDVLVASLCFDLDQQWAGGHGNSWAGDKMFLPGALLVIHLEYFFFF